MIYKKYKFSKPFSIALLVLQFGSCASRENPPDPQKLFESVVKLRIDKDAKVVYAKIDEDEIRVNPGWSYSVEKNNGDRYCFRVGKIDESIGMINVEYRIIAKKVSIESDYDGNFYKNFHIRVR